MVNAGPILIIEDDIDDQEIIERAIRETGTTNDVVFLNNGADALDYMRTMHTQPFLILCDINMPKLNGIELKMKIDQDPDLRKKSIPFVFFTTTANRMSVNLAYTRMTIQGFFEKSSNYTDMVNTLKLILNYWNECRHPNADG
jgi:CheY-like chemotaxis protein